MTASLAWAVFVGGNNAGLANEEALSVRLFSTHKLLTKLVLRAPFIIESTGAVPVVISGVTPYEILPMGSRAGMCQLLVHGAQQGRVFSLPLTLRSISAGGVVVCGAKPGELRRYRGKIICRQHTKNALTVINLVNRRDYVASVVGGEMPAGFPVEALKAQAVLTQTRISRANKILQLNDSTEDECYKGLDTVRPDVLNAVQSVWGQILTYDGRPVRVYYHSTCGGGTSSSDSVFGAAAQCAYLSSVKCNYCAASPFYQIHKQAIPARVFTHVFGSPDIFVSERDEAQRPLKIKVGKNAYISGYEFWLKLGGRLGWDKAPGTRFWIDKTDEQRVMLSSNGCGHGVGLCQWGARGLALAGSQYPEILNFFFPAARLLGSRRDINPRL